MADVTTTAGVRRAAARRAVALFLVLGIVVPAAVAWLGVGRVLDLQQSVTLAPASVPAGPVFSTSGRPETLRLASVSALETRFRLENYTLDSVRSGGSLPPLMLRRLPKDWATEMPVDKRKSLFFRTLLPLVMLANREVALDRQTLLDLRGRIGHLSSGQARTLADLAQRYQVDLPPRDEHGQRDWTALDWMRLLRRADTVPSSLALAQGALESGWGRSRFAQQGNALFGQWTWEPGAGMVPEGREEGKTHAVRRFDSLMASVRGYIRNINTANAYRELRQRRAALRASGTLVTGRDLAGHLTRYSEEGADYVKKVRAMISANRLAGFDGLARR